MDELQQVNPGDRIGRYQIVKPIGEGSFGRIFHATDSDLARAVALKISRAHRPDRELNPLLRNEAHILAQLSHPSIQAIYDIGQHRGRLYVVLEYVERSLETEIEVLSARPPRERLVEIVAKVADALDYVHRRGYVHRDVKPRAILLDSIGQPKLSRFELAIESRNLYDPDYGAVAGTIHYMAPEQLRAEKGQIGPHTDVWGLGVTLHEALTGRFPFEGSIEEIAKMALTSTPHIPTSIPRELQRICLKCLSKDPAGRYRTAALLAEDLRAWQRSITPSKQQRVFICHSSGDRRFVESEIISLLETHGIKTWYSKADIQTGAEWDRSILHGLQSCDWFLLVMSPRSTSSEWVDIELHWAMRHRKNRIVPVLIEHCDPEQFHLRMPMIQYVDFRTDLQEARQRLLSAFEEDEAAT